MPVVQDWPEHLRKNVSTAQQVLRKILPEEIKAMPTETGGWKYQAMTDYSAVLREVRLDAISTILQEVKLSVQDPVVQRERTMNDVMIVVSAGSK